MPKGHHKGGKRHFTNFEATEEERIKREKEKQWRRNRGESDSDEEESGEGSSGEESESSEEEAEVKAPKPKGVSGLLETHNLNRQVPKFKKASDIDLNDCAKPQLSRKEREEIERQRAAAHYQKLHASGKTEEARADLARLAIIRKQREDAAKRKEEEKREKEAAAEKKREQVAKALNKKKKS